MADFAPHDLTSNTSHSPFVVSSTNYFVGYDPWNAFDGDPGANDGWLGTTPGADRLKLDCGTGISYILASYDVKSIEWAYSSRAPKDWTLEGSNNDSDWDIIDTVTGETSWSSAERRSFVCDVQTTAYRYFRINITANNGDGSYTGVGELYLYEYIPPVPGPPSSEHATGTLSALRIFRAASSPLTSIDYLPQSRYGLTITRGVNGSIETLSAVIKVAAGAFPESIGSAIECDLQVDPASPLYLERVFTGYIARIQPKKLNQDYCDWRIDCQGITRDLANVSTETEVFADTTDKAIIEYLMAKYFPTVSTDGVSEVDTIAAVDLSHKTLLDCLKTLSDLTGAIFYLDPLSVLWYHDPQEYPASHGLTEAATGPTDPAAIPAAGFTVTEEFTTPCNWCEVRNAFTIPQDSQEETPAATGDDGYVSRVGGVDEYPPAGAYTVDDSAATMRAERTRTNNASTTELDVRVNADSGSDGYISCTSTSYPPSGETVSVYTIEEDCICQNSKSGASYIKDVAVFGFDTSALPDDAEITGAVVVFYEGTGNITDAGARVVGEWYDRPDPDPDTTPIQGADWAANPDMDRQACDFALIDEGPLSPYNVTLSNPDVFISRTGYTWLRLCVTTTGTPTGENSLTVMDRSHPGIGNPGADLQIIYRSAGNVYKVAVALLRFDTSDLPVGAVVTGASLGLRVSAKNATIDAPDIGIEWLAGTYPIDNSDWTSTPAQSAVAFTPLIGLPAAGVTWNVPLLNAIAQVNLSGYTGLRIHLRTAATPTGANYIDFATQESANAPKLTVSYTTGSLFSGSYQDDASIALYGQFERRIVDTALISSAQAVARATAEVTKDAYPSRQLTASVWMRGLGLGQWTHVDFTSFALSYDYAISGVTIQEQSDGTLKYEVQMGDYRRDLIQFLRSLT